jgi:hypothetical protein
MIHLYPRLLHPHRSHRIALRGTNRKRPLHRTTSNAEPVRRAPSASCAPISEPRASHARPPTDLCQSQSSSFLKFSTTLPRKDDRWTQSRPGGWSGPGSRPWLCLVRVAVTLRLPAVLLVGYLGGQCARPYSRGMALGEHVVPWVLTVGNPTTAPIPTRECISISGSGSL